MQASELKEIVLQELRYNENPHLTSPFSSNGRLIPNIEDVYVVQNVPVVYFSQLNDGDPNILWNLHRHVWNESKVPLLYVMLPQEIRVYNCYEPPAKEPSELDSSERLLQHLKGLTDVETARRKIQETLFDQGYDRLHLETGVFWSTPEGQRIHREKRADQTLLKEMDEARRQLVQELDTERAYVLLGRSIFIRYLEDREIISRHWFKRETDGIYENYLDVLQNYSMTLHIFRSLSARFNGDLFPIDTHEEEYIQQQHLNILRGFLKGEISGQLTFCPYDFKYIPIELISGIYDTFLSPRKRQDLGAYYTPLPLVDVVLNETLPRSAVRSDMTILDPACGSGVFLVRAYQKLIDAWKRKHEQPSPENLANILKQNIFGVDIQPEAVYIAAFSLYLAMLDNLKNEEIQDHTFRFPKLKGTNLIHDDFFSSAVSKQFSGVTFDRIIGNPPWGKGTLKGESLQWVQKTGVPVWYKQIVQAFLWRVTEFCADDGEVALLAPTKSTILLSETIGEKTGDEEENIIRDSQEPFREKFFRTYNVRAIINFSALVYELFPKSLSPVVAMFYSAKKPKLDGRIVYGVPKPSALSQRLGAIVLDTTEVKYLERNELLLNPTLWKIILFGTLLDAILIDRLKSDYPTLGDQQNPESLQWNITEGYIGERKKKKVKTKEATWLTGKPFVETKHFSAYSTVAHSTVQEKNFERPRVPEVYQSPIALVRRSTCQASFYNTGFIAYRNKISGITGTHEQISLLKWLVAYINSPLAKYYHFLTSTSWAVERGTIIHEEYKQMPFLIPEKDDPRLQKVLHHFDEIVKLYQQQDREMLHSNVHDAEIQYHQETINSLVFDLYELTTLERQLVEDMLKYGVEFFQWFKRKNRKPLEIAAVRSPTAQMLQEYATIFIEITTALMRYQGKTMNATVYHNGAPLSVISFEVVSMDDVKEVVCIEQKQLLEKILQDLDKLLVDQQAPALYMRRHVRIYDDTTIHLVRPSEQRFWSRSQARVDANALLVDLLNRSRKESGGYS